MFHTFLCMPLDYKLAIYHSMLMVLCTAWIVVNLKALKQKPEVTYSW